MKRSGLSMAAMVATVVMVLTVSTYAITARAVNPVCWYSRKWLSRSDLYAQNSNQQRCIFLYADDWAKLLLYD